MFLPIFSPQLAGHKKLKKKGATTTLPSSTFLTFEHHLEIFTKDLSDTSWLTSISN